MGSRQEGSWVFASTALGSSVDQLISDWLHGLFDQFYVNHFCDLPDVGWISKLSSVITANISGEI